LTGALLGRPTYVEDLVKRCCAFFRYLSVNSPELIFDLVNAKPGTNHSTNPTNPNGSSKR